MNISLLVLMCYILAPNADVGVSDIKILDALLV